MSRRLDLPPPAQFLIDDLELALRASLPYLEIPARCCEAGSLRCTIQWYRGDCSNVTQLQLEMPPLQGVDWMRNPEHTEQTRRPMTPFRRCFPFFTLIASAAAIVLLAGWTSPDWTIPFCERMGGRMEERPLADGSGGSTRYCVFADGTQCSASEIYARTCKLPAAVAPSHPLVLPTGDGSLTGFMDAMPPWDLGELVEHAPLIVIGEVGPGQLTEHFPYENGKEITVDAFNSPLAGMPATDFIINVEQVIRDDGKLARGEPVILRELGDAEELKRVTAGTGYAVTYTGDRYLFLLYPNPDGQTYGFYHAWWSRLLIDGDSLRFSAGAQPPLLVAGRDAPITLDEFIQFVQREDGQAPGPALLERLLGMVKQLFFPD